LYLQRPAPHCGDGADQLHPQGGHRADHVLIRVGDIGQRSQKHLCRFTWADVAYFDTDLAPLRKVHPALMDFSTWLEKSGRALLASQLSAPAA
jgi:hypothetical protein